MDLPNGIALIRLDTPEKKVLLVSDRLAKSHALAARVMAAVLVAQGQPIVVLRVIDVLAVINAAA